MERYDLRVMADPNLRPEEKETALHVLGNSKRLEIHTLHPTAVRGLLAQPEFEVDEVFTKTIKGEEVIVGIKGTLPIGSLKIGRPRSVAHLSRVFSRRSSTQKRRAVCQSDTGSQAQSVSIPLSLLERGLERDEGF